MALAAHPQQPQSATTGDGGKEDAEGSGAEGDEGELGTGPMDPPVPRRAVANAETGQQKSPVGPASGASQGEAPRRRKRR